MCFYNDDYEWIAHINTKSFIVSDSPAECYECRRPITAGEWRATVYQQEHEGCQICEDDCSDAYISHAADDYDSDEEHAAALSELASHTHDYGETFSAEICRECCLILEAVYDLEEKEGCPEHARQPAYGSLREEMHEDSGKWGEKKYARHAVEMFPELAANEMCSLAR